MIKRLTASDFIQEFRDYNRQANFSADSLVALFDYLEQIDENWELDVIALCCDYTEDTIDNVLKEYSLESIEDLSEQTTVIYSDAQKVCYQVF